MSFTETTNRSWFSRLGGGIAGFFIGIIIVIAAIVILFMNEGWSVNTYRALVEGAGIVKTVDSAAVDPTNEGKLIHITGAVTVSEVPTDNNFGITAEGAVSLVRNVDMYQWVEESKSETKTKIGGGEETVTTYTYSRDWRPDYVDSSKFKQPDGHFNPQPAIEKDSFVVAQANVGAFQVAGDKLASLGESKQLNLTNADAETFKSGIATNLPIGVNAGTVYVGQSVSNPQVGDMKISYERTDISQASFVAAQHNSGLTDYKTSNGNTIFLSAAGDQTAPKMFETAQTENTIFTWLIRVGGLFGIFIGFVMTFSIFGIIGDVIPFVGSIIRFGTSLVAFLLTIVIGPLVIAIAWFAYRPLLSIGILAVAAVIVGAILYLRRGKAAATETTATPA